MAVNTGNMSDDEANEASAAAIAEKFGVTVTSGSSDVDSAPNAVVNIEGATAAAADFGEQVGGKSVLTADDVDVKFMIRDTEFTLVEELPGHVMMKLAASEDPNIPPYERVKVFMTSIMSCVVEEQRSLLNDVFENSNPAIGSTEYNTICKDLIEAVVGRPTV